jgi:hypothetical protein
MSDHHSLSQRASAVGAASRETSARMLLLLVAGISFVLSVSLWFAGNQLQGIFVGLWVPSILALGSIILPRDGRR